MKKTVFSAVVLFCLTHTNMNLSYFNLPFSKMKGITMKVFATWSFLIMIAILISFKPLSAAGGYSVSSSYWSSTGQLESALNQGAASVHILTWSVWGLDGYNYWGAVANSEWRFGSQWDSDLYGLHTRTVNRTNIPESTDGIWTGAHGTVTTLLWVDLGAVYNGGYGYVPLGGGCVLKTIATNDDPPHCPSVTRA